jgi:hypothetical protein
VDADKTFEIVRGDLLHARGETDLDSFDEVKKVSFLLMQLVLQ